MVAFVVVTVVVVGIVVVVVVMFHFLFFFSFSVALDRFNLAAAFIGSFQCLSSILKQHTRIPVLIERQSTLKGHSHKLRLTHVVVVAHIKRSSCELAFTYFTL